VDVVEKIIYTMKVHTLDSTVQVKSCQTLWLLGKPVANRQQIADYGIGQVLVSTMRTHSKDALVMEAACAALKNIDTDLNVLMKMGAGQLVVNALRNFIEKPKTIEHACGLLSSLARSLLNSEQLISFGVADILKNIMVKYQTNSKIQVGCLRAIWSLCNQERNKKFLWQAGVPKLVVDAMTNHSYDFLVQESGCAAIWLLGRFYSLMKFGACDAVIDAMNSNMDNGRVIRYCCEAIHSLGSLEICCHKFIALDAPSLLIRTLQTYSDDNTMVIAACKAIFALTREETPRARVMDLYPAIGEEIINTINKHLGTASIISVGAPIITVLSNTSHYVDELMGRDAGGAILRAADLHPYSAEVQSYCLLAMRNLSHTEQYRKDLVSKGAIDTVLSAVKNHPEHDMIQKRGKALFEWIKTPMDEDAYA